MRANDDSPGPGNYDVKDPNLESKKIPFSSQLREILSVKKNANPGPGSYDSNYSLLGLKDCKFGSEIKLKPKLNDSPGPARYEIKNIIGNEGYKYSLNSRSTSKIGSAIKAPSPATYDIKEPESSKKGFKYSKNSGIELQIFRKIPGPGNYELPSLRCIYKNQPNIVFGKSSREIDKVIANPVPGPDQYLIDTKNKKGYTLTSRKYLPDSKLTNPGPGSYNPKYKIIYESSSSSGIGYGNRSEMKVKKSIPAPGQYNYSLDNKLRNISFGKSSRPEMINNKFSPGPGNYHIDTSIGKTADYVKKA